MATLTTDLSPADRKRAAIARELLLRFRGFVFEGDDRALLEDYNPRSLEAVKTADAVLTISRKRFRTA
jgi:hypothetical protein